MTNLESTTKQHPTLNNNPGSERMTGPELRAFTRFLGHNSSTFATEVGVNRRTVARWERDELTIPDHVAEQIEGAFTSVYEHARLLAGMNPTERKQRLTTADRNEQTAYALLKLLTSHN